ncbi:MAG: hypothetical protein ABSD31_12860 [Candidatus Binataceae bacterium]|jgi:hypothetical protein
MTSIVPNKGPNTGRLHAVKCEWCQLKMACSCMFDEIREDERNCHPLVMCPKCQVTEFLNFLFGEGHPKPDEQVTDLRGNEKI